MKALRFKPVAYYKGDDTTPLQDYSGYNRVATIAGTESHGIALIADATYSQRFYTGNTGTFAAPVYIAAREASSFSLTAVVYPITSAGKGEQQILSHGTNYDGLTINGSVVSFSTKYVNSGSAKCSFDMGMIQKADVVGTHTSTKNSLYVNGVMVAEVDITQAQQADTYDISDPNFSSGRTASSQRILVNGLGFYTRALQTEEVVSLYLHNSRRAEGSPSKMYNGEDILLSTAVRPLFLDTGWFNDLDWQTASLNNVVADGDQLHATMQDNLTLAGSWIDSIDLYSGIDPVNINSVNLWWVGKNETVEASIDGTTWSAVTKGVPLSVIPTGFNPTDKSLYVRVSFPAGVDEAYVDSMQVNGYTSNTTNSGNRTLTYTNPTVPFDEQIPFTLRDDWGVRIGASGSIEIGTDQSGTPTPVRTIEMWVKPDADAATTIGGATTATYVNGVAGNTLPGGEWTVYHRVLSADNNAVMNINITGLVGKVAFYPTALSAADVAAIYANYTGVNTIRYDGSGSIALAEPASSTTIYAADWSIESA